MATIHYETPARRIGKHEWRLIVRDHRVGYGPPRATEYQWRRIRDADMEAALGKGHWRSQSEWSRHDINRRGHGMPASLAKLYADHKAAILAALNPECAQ